MREPSRLAEILLSINPTVYGSEHSLLCRNCAMYIKHGARPDRGIIEQVQIDIRRLENCHLKELLMERMAWYQSLYSLATPYKPEQVTDVRKLRRGNILQNKGSGNSYVIIDDSGGIAPLAVNTVRITNPDEWLVIRFK